MFFDLKFHAGSKMEVSSSINYPVIDAHVHLGGRYRSEQYWEKYDLVEVLTELQKLGVYHIVDLELFSRKHWDFALERTKQYRSFVSLCAPINFDYINDDNFEKITRNEMYYYYLKGACGFKVWKNLGLSIRKKDGRLYTLNDQRIKFIWEEAANLKLPIVIHVGDPPSFWNPVNLQNERYMELVANPKWSYCNLEVKHEDLIKQLEKLLCDNPNTNFIVAHMCSEAHNLGHISKMLSAYNNLYVDIAAVLSEIGRQPIEFRKFASEYCNRILFGTDLFAGDNIPHAAYYRFLETSDDNFPYNPDGTYTQGVWNISGCKLSENILKKIYFENARRIFKIKF